MIRVYLARSMSQRPKKEVVSEALSDAVWFRQAGFDVLCPVEVEAVKAEPGTLQATKQQIVVFWKRDKEMIRKADVLIHMTPHLRSDGAWHEVGYKRYHLWEPVIHIYPEGKLPPESAISYLEDDVVVDSREEAVEWIYRVYGTPLKRFKWKMLLLNRCLFKYLKMRISWLWK